MATIHSSQGSTATDVRRCDKLIAANVCSLSLTWHAV